MSVKCNGCQSEMRHMHFEGAEFSNGTTQVTQACECSGCGDVWRRVVTVPTVVYRAANGKLLGASASDPLCSLARQLRDGEGSWEGADRSERRER